MKVGTTKDQGLDNKPSAAVHLGALAARTLPQYNTIQQYVTLQRIKCTSPRAAGVVASLTSFSGRRAVSGVELSVWHESDCPVKQSAT